MVVASRTHERSGDHDRNRNPIGARNASDAVVIGETMSDSIIDCIKRDLDSIAIGAYEPEPGFYQRRIEGYRQMAMELSQTPELSPELQERLDAVLSTYQDLHQDMKLLKYAEDVEKQKAYDILKEAGLTNAKIGEILLAEVGGDTSKFNPQKFVAAGGDLAMYNAAIDKKPKKKFLKITLPGEREHESE